MQRVKRRIFSGVVCEQEVYTVSDRANIKKAEPRPRFKDDEERAQHRIGISKRKHQRLVNENFSPLSLYSTLTFDDDSEVHTFSEARRIRDNYFRRLQRACPDAKIIIYMGRGKSTNRIHFHMISDGIPEETISGKWNDGSVIHIRHLREHNYYNGVDYGQDYTGLADYLFNHWTPEQGGHRWKATRNLRQPEKEAPTLALRTYTEKKAPIAPKGYKLVEARATKWGYKKPCKCVKFYDQRFSFRKIDFIYSPSPAFQRSRTRALSRVRSTAKPLALDNESAGVIKAGRRRGYKINREGSVQNTDRGSPPDRR